MKNSFLDYYRKNPRDEPVSAEGLAKRLFTVKKADDERRMVFGWASIAEMPDGSAVQDYQADIIDISELENAVYSYVILYRSGGEMHERGGVAVLIESCVFTEDKMAALGIPKGMLPYGWWIGLKITDESVWEKVKDGTYRMFSIEGEAIRQEVDAEEEGDKEV